MDDITLERAQRSALRLERLVATDAPKEILLNEILLNEILLLKRVLDLDPNENGRSCE